MNAGSYPARLRRGIKETDRPQLYVKRRTRRQGKDRVLVNLPAPVRYALCVWASYRMTKRGRTVSQELTKLLWEAMEMRLGEDAEMILEQAYQVYSKRCEEAGQVNIFEAVDR
jgi:hypothetical protein